MNRSCPCGHSGYAGSSLPTELLSGLCFARGVIAPACQGIAVIPGRRSQEIFKDIQSHQNQALLRGRTNSHATYTSQPLPTPALGCQPGLFGSGGPFIPTSLTQGVLIEHVLYVCNATCGALRRRRNRGLASSPELPGPGPRWCRGA